LFELSHPIELIDRFNPLRAEVRIDEQDPHSDPPFPASMK
jgi:hypothetical protein